MIIKIIWSSLAGFLLFKSYEANFWFLAVAAFVILIWVLDRSRRNERILLLVIFSAISFGLQLTWLKVIGPDAWLLVTLLAVLVWPLLGLIKVDRNNFRTIIIFGSGVVLGEAIRSHIPFGGFPWALVAYSQVDGPLVYLARIGSTSLVTFSVIALAGLLLQMFSRKFISRLALLIIFIVIMTNLPMTESEKSIKLAAIQGNVPRLGLELSAQRRAVLDNHLNLTEQYLNQTKEADLAKLIIWPESSTDIDPLTNREVGVEISKLVNRAGVPILVGATTRGVNPEGPRNSGIFWTQTGPTEIYTKNNLVPFGEYIPFRAVLSEYIDRIALVPNDYIAGTKPGLFKVDGVIFADVICFEIAFGDYVRQVVNQDAQFITVQTNNATYGQTDQPEQQFTISRFRAIEHQRAIIVASTSGISGAIDQNGRVLAKTSVFEPAVVNVDLPIVTQTSISDRFPRWASLVALLNILIHSVSQGRKLTKTRAIS